jgi:MinD-like ATPase involved in chromosome partitioning or flagellar assembly
MTLIALAGGKGAPGVTTAAVALAAVWPRPAILVECDPAGGDLAYRLENESGRPLAQDRGVLSLAAALRTQSQAGQVWEHVQRLRGGLPVLVGPSSSVQSAALGRAWPSLCQALSGLEDADVLVDCGRVSAGSPALAVVSAAELTVLFARATVDAIAHLRSAIEVLAAAGAGPIGVVVISGEGRARKQVQEVLTANRLPARVIGALAVDEQGAAALRGEWTRGLDVKPLITSARQAAHEIDTELLASAQRRRPAELAR